MTDLVRIIGLRPAELQRALPLSFAYAFVMAALYVLKPVRNALFLERFGAQNLPKVMLLVALLGALTAATYGQLSRRLGVERLVAGMFLVLVACLLGFRLWLPLGMDAGYYAFYVWVAVYGLVATSLVWQIANMRFDPREARRLFGVIGTGGIAGAIGGGVLTATVTTFIGAENLILLGAALVAGAWLCLRTSMRGQSLDRARGDLHSQAGALSGMRSSRLLSWMALTAAVIGVVAVVVDVQFNHYVEDTMPTTNDKAAFFGRFFAYFNVLAIAVQLLVTTRVLTTVGVGPALLILPVALSLGSAALVLAPGLLAASLLKMADASLRHSIHKSAFEILFIPVPSEIKKRAKLFLDATVDSAATGLGALLVLYGTRQLGISYVGLTWLSWGLLGVWFVCVWQMRRAYVDALRQALARRELDTSELTIEIAEAGTVDVLLRALDDGKSARRASFALDALASVSDTRIVPHVEPLMTHPSPEVRMRALRVLAAQPIDAELLTRVQGLLGDADHDVRVEAVRIVAATGPRGPQAVLRRYLEADDPALRSAALGAIAAYGTGDELSLVTPAVVEDLLSLPGEEGERVRANVATVLGDFNSDALRPFWSRLRTDPSERVVRETIHSAGRSGQAEHLPWLFGLLEDRRYRMDARLALARFGPVILPALGERMQQLKLSPRMWRVLPRIVARIDSQRSVSLLLERALSVDWGRRRPLIEALGKLRKRFAELGFDDRRVDDLLMDEIGACYFHRLAIGILAPATMDAPGRLLLTTLEQRQSEALGRAFLLLGLRHNPRDMASTYRALSREGSRLSGSALEFLDNVLGSAEKDLLLPLVDPEQRFRLEQVARARFGISLSTRDEVVVGLLSRSDAWLRACALYAASDASEERLSALSELAAHDEDAIVRDTARSLLARARAAVPAAEGAHAERH